MVTVPAVCPDDRNTRDAAAESLAGVGPAPLRSNWPWWLAGFQFRPGAERPSIARATLTREARRRTRIRQLHRRGVKGLLAHIATAQ